MKKMILIFSALTVISCTKQPTKQDCTVLIKGQKEGFKLRYAYGESDTTTINSKNKDLRVVDLPARVGDVIWVEVTGLEKQNYTVSVFSDNNETVKGGLAWPLVIAHQVK